MWRLERSWNAGIDLGDRMTVLVRANHLKFMKVGKKDVPYSMELD